MHETVICRGLELVLSCPEHRCQHATSSCLNWILNVLLFVVGKKSAFIVVARDEAIFIIQLVFNVQLVEATR